MQNFCVKKYEQITHHAAVKDGKATLAFLSDFHNGNESTAALILQTLHKIKPDIVLIGGDMLVGKPKVSYFPALALVKELCCSFPVIYAYGNHEYRMCIYPETYYHAGEAYENELKKLPLTLLRNDSFATEIQGLPFCFTGLEIPAKNYKKWKKVPFPLQEMQVLVGKPRKDAINILLAHNPQYKNTYFAWGADTILSGHMHGGIVRLFGRPVIGTDGRIFPRYGYGRMDEEQTSMFVSAGLGEHTIPFRLFNPRELLLLTITNTY